MKNALEFPYNILPGGESTMSPFERGFHRAIALWKSGDTWEVISHRPDYDASESGRGMFAAVETMSGWIDVAEREAKAFGVSTVILGTLIDEARKA